MTARLALAALCAVIALFAVPVAGADAAKAKDKRVSAAACGKATAAAKKAKRHGRKASAKTRRRVAACRKQAAERRKAAAKRKRAAARQPATAGRPGTLPAAPPASSAPVSSGSAGPEPAADPTCDPTSPWLGARAEDVDGVFRLALTRTCVNAGTLKVDYFNNDASRHDVWIRDLDGGTEPREVIPEQNGGARAQGEVTISAGRWQLYCTLAGHTSMRATVTAITP